MPLNLASPGIVVREVDLTVGRIDPVSGSIGAIVGTFEKGPVSQPTLVKNENDLLKIFGEPKSVDKHYENWLVASSYLAYGGTLQVVRADDDELKNAKVGIGTSIKIKNSDHYIQLGYDENTIKDFTLVAKNPGSWANGIKVAMIDSKADQILSGINTAQGTTFTPVISDRSGNIVGGGNTIGISTASITVGLEVNCDIAGVVSAGTTVSSIGNDFITLSNNFLVSTPVTTTFDFGTTSVTTQPILVGYGVTQNVTGRVISGLGTTTLLNGYVKGIVTEVLTNNQVSVKLLSYIPENGSEQSVNYEVGSPYNFSTGSLNVYDNSGNLIRSGSVSSQLDWYDSQTITVSTGSNIPWNTVADRPSTSAYASARNCRNDEVHIVVIDDTGKITGNAGTILEKFLSLSKAVDAEYSVGSSSYWRKYLFSNSSYLYGGSAPTGITTTSFSSGFTLSSTGGWDKNSNDVSFAACGALNLTLVNGFNYDGNDDISETGSLLSTISNIAQGYSIFDNTENYKIDFLLMGSANYSKNEAQALANKIISVAESRKDSLAFITPYRGAFLVDTVSGTVTVNNDDTITDNIVDFFGPITSTTYAVFDSGYKYMYDRFNGTFRYVPLNGDIAGTCARNDIAQFPWYSPAGNSRGSILNAVKLAYNPNKIQRDKLYTNRVNPVIFSPGSGIVLFGDKTAYGKSSAFDRINVRRLFIYLERAISQAAKDQLFEFNDEITRTNFVNIIEPFLRDVQAKRGIFDYVVVCDETNNTAAVIDNNEFVADIYIKPARSINFIGLTFVATRTGVSFEEVIGQI